MVRLRCYTAVRPRMLLRAVLAAAAFLQRRADVVPAWAAVTVTET
jgi:hypothetical protein